MTICKSILSAVRALNANYGIGDVRELKLFPDGKIQFTQEPFGMKPRKRIGRIIGNSVHALGHQKRIGKAS